MTTIRIRPISADAFAPFGDLLTPRDRPDRMINEGRCERHHALATVQRGGCGSSACTSVCYAGRAALSLPRSVPGSTR